MDVAQKVNAFLLTLKWPQGPEGAVEGEFASSAAAIIGGDYVRPLENDPVLLSLRERGVCPDPAAVTEIVASLDDQGCASSFLGAVAALQAFLQANFTGPALQFDPNEIITNAPPASALDTDGEPAFRLTAYPGLIMYATSALRALRDRQAKSDGGVFAGSIRWWLSRAAVAHQALLDNPVSTLFEEVTTGLTASTLETVIQGLDGGLARDLQIRFWIERTRAEITFNQDVRASESLKRATEASGLAYVLTGAKAKRTKYQQHETTQLVLLARSNNEAAGATSQPSEPQQNPAALELNSDLLLERPAYAKAIASHDSDEIPEQLRQLDPNNQPILQDIDTAIVLLRIALVQATTPHKDPLVTEELTAMGNRIINSPESTVNWSLFSRALWLRSIFESDSAKTVERGTLQMQSLVEELGHASAATFIPKGTGSVDEDAVSNNQAVRLAYIHQLMPQPKWDMDVTLAEKFMSLGALKSAIGVYERLQMWAEVALCYAAVGQEEHAEQLLRDHLDKEPNDYRGWSILGDIKLDPELWKKAWDMGRYAPAKRSLGRFFHSPPRDSGYTRNVEVAIVHLADSLKVNPINAEAWFLYGVCGLESEQWELASEAFSRCVTMDETDAKSWSNLASAFLRQGKKKEAFNALKQAVRAGSEQGNWRIWSNYTTVALDLGNWPEVLVGTKQLINLRKDKDGETALDSGILEALCQVLITQEYKSEDSARPDYFQRSCIDLFVNVIPSLITTDAYLWKLVAKVHMWQKKPWAALDDYERGFRIYTRLPQVELEEKYWNEAVDYCQDLVDAYTNLGPLPGRHGDGSLVCKDWAYKARSTIRLLMGRGKRAWEDTPGWDRLKEMKEGLSS